MRARCSTTTNAYDLDLRVYRPWDLSVFALEAGLGGGLSLLTADFDTRGVAPSRQALAPFLALGGGVSLDLGRGGVYLHLDLAVETHFIRMRDDALHEAEQTAHLAFRSGLSVGKYF